MPFIRCLNSFLLEEKVFPSLASPYMGSGAAADASPRNEHIRGACHRSCPRAAAADRQPSSAGLASPENHRVPHVPDDQSAGQAARAGRQVPARHVRRHLHEEVRAGRGAHLRVAGVAGGRDGHSGALRAISHLRALVSKRAAAPSRILRRRWLDSWETPKRISCCRARKHLHACAPNHTETLSLEASAN